MSTVSLISEDKRTQTPPPQSGMPRKHCYSELTHPTMQDAISHHNHSGLHLAVLVAEFAQHMAAAHESFSKEIMSVIDSFRKKTQDLKAERPVDSPSSLITAWECLLQESEVDTQAHMDIASLLIKNVYKPLEEMATHKSSQSQKLYTFRENFDDLLRLSEQKLYVCENDYHDCYQKFRLSVGTCREVARQDFYNSHNEYVLQLRASNCAINRYQQILPQVLEELEEIHIDTSNTVNVAIESHALLLLTKAKEQHRKFEDLLKICHQVNPQSDVSYFVKNISPEPLKVEIEPHQFTPPEFAMATQEENLQNQLIVDRHTESSIQEKRRAVQKEAAELTSYIKQNQNVTQTLVNMCQRNLANHLYAKVYETQEDMCRKRHEIRVANMQLASVRAQIDMLTPKQNGSVENADQDKNEQSSSIKGMWKKAFKSLKSKEGSEKNWLTKRGSFHKRKDSNKEPLTPEPETSADLDPVYSLLKCAADLPKSGKACGHAHCSGGQGSRSDSGNTSKNSSPASSARQSPKSRRKKLCARMKSFSLDTPDPPKQLLLIDESTKKKSSSCTNTCIGVGHSPRNSMAQSPKSRRKKLNARMKSFSLDTPDLPKQLLAIDESTKKKSSSFTNTCFGAAPNSPLMEGGLMSAENRRLRLGHRSSSLEIEESLFSSQTPSPHQSPKTQRSLLPTIIYVVLYSFRGKEKDDLDLRAGWRVTLMDTSDPDWWKGKCGNKIGFFPASYVQRLQTGQSVFQVMHAMHLSEGENGMKLHKDQIVIQIGEEDHGMVLVRGGNNKQAMCPLKYLLEI